MKKPVQRTLSATLITASLFLASLAGVASAQPQNAPRGGHGEAGHPMRSQMQSLLTPEERNQFRDKMRAAQSREERAEVQKQIRGLAEQRAKEKGITLSQRAEGRTPRADSARREGERRPQLFTQEERQQHRDKLRAAKTPEERQALRRDLRAQAELRAKEKGITLPQRPRGDRPKGSPSSQNS